MGCLFSSPTPPTDPSLVGEWVRGTPEHLRRLRRRGFVVQNYRRSGGFGRTTGTILIIAPDGRIHYAKYSSNGIFMKGEDYGGRAMEWTNNSVQATRFFKKNLAKKGKTAQGLDVLIFDDQVLVRNPTPGRYSDLLRMP